MVRPVVTNPEALGALKQIIDGKDVKTIFAIPHFNPNVGDIDGKALTELRYLSECLETLASQVRPDGTPEDRFAVVVVNDASPAYRAENGDPEKARELEKLFRHTIQDFADRLNIIAIEQKVNGGIGNARNPVIVMAAELEIESVSFVDHDDQVDPRRVYETIRAFEDPQVDLVYSAFYPIDRDGEVLGNGSLELGVRRYLELISELRPEGQHRWKDLFLEHDYYNLPSATSVRTSLMAENLFTRPLCEDNSLWPVLMAHGGHIAFIDTLTGYRVLPGEATASRAANERFFDVAYVSADLEGMHGAVTAAYDRGFLAEADRDIIFSVFMQRSIDYNRNKPNGKHRPDIAATLEDLCEGRLSFEDALDIKSFCARVNEHAAAMRQEVVDSMTQASGLTKENVSLEDWNNLRGRIQVKITELGIEETPIPNRIQVELDREAANEPITYRLVTGSGLHFRHDEAVRDTGTPGIIVDEGNGEHVSRVSRTADTGTPGIKPIFDSMGSHLPGFNHEDMAGPADPIIREIKRPGLES